MRRNLIIALVLMALLVILTVQNAADVSLKAFFWECKLSISILVLICFIIGVLTGILVSIPDIRKKVKEQAEKTKKNQQPVK